MFIKTNSKQGKRRFFHPNVQRGWVYNAPRVGYNQGQLKDEEYHNVLATHNPLWRHIVNHYTKEAECPVAVLGYGAIPIAIELSQWTYPITYITDSLEGVKKAKRDCEIQAGFFKNFYYFDFVKNCPQARIVTFIGILDEMENSEVCFYLDLLLRRCREVVCSVKNNRDWRKILADKYDINMSEYNNSRNCLLVIKENGYQTANP